MTEGNKEIQRETVKNTRMQRYAWGDKQREGDRGRQRDAHGYIGIQGGDRMIQRETKGDRGIRGDAQEHRRR